MLPGQSSLYVRLGLAPRGDLFIPYLTISHTVISSLSIPYLTISHTVISSLSRLAPRSDLNQHQPPLSSSSFPDDTMAGFQTSLPLLEPGNIVYMKSSNQIPKQLHQLYHIHPVLFGHPAVILKAEKDGQTYHVCMVRHYTFCASMRH